MPPRKYSRYTFCQATQQADGTLMLADYEPFPFQPLEDNTQYVAAAGDTWFTIAGRAFAPLPRPAGLYWILLDFQPQPVLDPTVPPAPGTPIWIPSVRTVTELIFSESRRQVTLDGEPTLAATLPATAPAGG